MTEYTVSLIWLASWPILIYLSYRFVRFNLAHLPGQEKTSTYPK